MNIDNYISSGIIEQYVLGLCNEAESIEINERRKNDISLNKAIEAFEIEFEQKMLEQTILPSQKVDDAILNKLQLLSNNEKISSNTINANGKLVSYSFLKWAAAAAIILLVVSAYFNYSLFKANKTQAALIDAKSKLPKSLSIENFEILKKTDITPVVMMGVGLHAVCRCTMFWDKTTGKVYVMVHHLVPPRDTQKEFRLWANVNGKQINIGKIDPTIKDKFVELSGMPTDATEFLVSSENISGASLPSEDGIYLKGKV